MIIHAKNERASGKLGEADEETANVLAPRAKVAAKYKAMVTIKQASAIEKVSVVMGSASC